MRLELLHIDECPNSEPARVRLEEALAALGHNEVKVHMRRLKTPSDILGSGFAGSPTITIDGADIFPEGAPADELACRVYKTPQGLSGLPTIDQLAEALRNNGL
ncbi:thioredoxin family protein [Pseudarthrobacter oxydans]|uniref:thioredoxin family protein n=1 Tax=Pseudarthrobacter oxydans TaxID=1671 RepID=UPI001571D09F|nr:thioredoxin family protein [Pseudarthrobacter oxydans]NSX36552.1 thioredoxin family protein [Pseudarthrobacter oxydans]